MGIKVLAVDDSRTIRDMLALVLGEAGYTVQTAEDGQDALDRIDDFEPDAIISDINMPRLDGFGFVQAVRRVERYRATPILVLTTESAPELKARARAAGATGWIVKPFDAEKLVRALQAIAG
ncbi:response regulator [Defluviimonas aestuarii]|uniref:response regulator n=1 Tax=Albidovulum aestuarii TaxID=1130726 RepID=UPI00249C7DE0|nr:response regulator [Defluviimonas aestuarii]MDI3335184.1 response regulator [Defluviimonas aestuarii]